MSWDREPKLGDVVLWSDGDITVLCTDNEIENHLPAGGLFSLVTIGHGVNKNGGPGTDIGCKFSLVWDRHEIEKGAQFLFSLVELEEKYTQDKQEAE